MFVFNNQQKFICCVLGHSLLLSEAIQKGGENRVDIRQPGKSLLIFLFKQKRHIFNVSGHLTDGEAIFYDEDGCGGDAGGFSGGDGGAYRGNGRGRARGGGTKRRRPGVDGNNGEKKQRKCGLCHEPGHVRTKCTMRDKSGIGGWN